VKSETRYLEDQWPPQPETAARLLRIAQGPLISACVIAGLIVIWEAGVRLLHAPEFILPAPSTIWRDTSELGLGIVPHIAATLLTIVGGYLIALAISLPLAIAARTTSSTSLALRTLRVSTLSIPNSVVIVRESG